MKYCLLFIFCICLIFTARAQVSQSPPPSLDSLKQEILQLNQKVDHIQMNLETAGRRTKTGILVSIIGYSVTIAGGLTLSENKDLGNALLVTGGAIGITGTVVLINGFRDIKLAGQDP